MTDREFIESIRQEYSGLRDSPRVSLKNSIRTLAADLYEKDSHFIFELIQNAEDNDYESNKPPSLHFEIRQQEIDGEFSPVLIVHNNETGFQEKHVKTLCRVGDSTKEKAQGYIGEKGIGFKSVFRITRCPYIFSNRFQFRLPEDDPETDLGYIVPLWETDLPAGIAAAETTIILPLNQKDSDVQTIVEALRDIAPETILFLKKLNSIKISVCLPDEDYTVKIEKHTLATSEESRLVELTYLINEETLETTHYWLTEVEFPKPENVQHEKRAGIESRRVSVAIPLEPNVHKGKLFAYLPVWEDTGLPFLINADFLLVTPEKAFARTRLGTRAPRMHHRNLRQGVPVPVNNPDLPMDTKILAYASIPLETHRPFLTPIVESIQKYLENQECVLVLPDRSLSRSSGARLCLQNFRAVLGSSDSFPRYLREDAWLVSPEIEAFSSQLKAIGVKPFLLTEVVACFQDTAWVQGHDLAWFISLFRYLSTQKKLKHRSSRPCNCPRRVS